MMKKLFILIFAFILMMGASGCAHTFKGRVIDAGTREPIEGAVVVVYWYKEKAVLVDSYQKLKNVKETLTDENGEWKIRGPKGRKYKEVSPLLGIVSLLPFVYYTIAPSFIIFKPGYGSTDPDGTIVEYKWEIWDGAPEPTIKYGGTVTHSYASTGIYNVYLTVWDDNDDMSAQDQAQVEVKSVENFDDDLKTKWGGMKAALGGGDIEGALNYFASDSQSVYSAQFTSLSTVLSAIAAEMNSAEIYLVEVDEGYAKYEILLTRNGRALSFHLMFIRDTDGIWRIWRF